MRVAQSVSELTIDRGETVVMCLSMFDHLIPKAEEIRAQASRRDSEKAADFVRRLVDTELEKQGLVDKLTGSGTEDATLEILSAIIMRAAGSGLDEVELYRFSRSPHSGGPAARDNGWEGALTGVPQQFHDLWLKYLKPRGYSMRFKPLATQADGSSDISILLSWGD
jgi:hypothetical protein